MHKIIDTVQDVIAQKRQTIKYRLQEADNIHRDISREQDEIFILENELQELQKNIYSGCATNVLASQIH